MNKLILNSAIWMMGISLAACSNHANDASNENEKVASSSLNSSQNTGSSNNDNLKTGKVELSKIYSQAITEYVKAISKKEQINFDTLYFGKQSGLPDMNLPAVISGSEIKILTQEEANNNKLRYSKSSPYINLIGFVEDDNAEFIFVTFYPEFQHQYDCYMNLIYNSEERVFDLDKLRIEVLIHSSCDPSEG